MKRSYTFEDSAVIGDLKYWGFHKGKQCAADGYPPGKSVKEMLAGRGGQSGHRVLVKDMPPRAWEINFRVMRLPSELVAVLIGRFCLPVRADGLPFSEQEVSVALGLSVRTYYRRLQVAKARYKSIIFGSCVA